MTARYHYARAMLARIDIEAESLPATTAPSDEAKLAAWIGDQLIRHGTLTTKYEAVVRAKDPATTIVAARSSGSRTGLLKCRRRRVSAASLLGRNARSSPRTCASDCSMSL